MNFRIQLLLICMMLVDPSVKAEFFSSGPLHKGEASHSPNITSYSPGLDLNSATSSPPQISAANLAVIVNVQDEQSRVLGRYYRERRGIPIENMIYVNFYPQGSSMDIYTFERIKKVIDSSSSESITAYAIAWTEPYRVDCLSMTSAITFGFDTRHCALGCEATKVSPLYGDSAWDSFLKPSMMLASTTLKSGKQLVDNGVSADQSHPNGKGVFLITGDRNRNVRQHQFPAFTGDRIDGLTLRTERKSFVVGEKDLLFYFTGSKAVPFLGTNDFLPGAIADHLTSAGGQLTDSYQMSALRWLEAGATGSYGTVVEPCNFQEKFPNIRYLLSHYGRGASLIEAYWRSVKMPGQGVFIGEPLAAPFKRSKTHHQIQAKFTGAYHQGNLQLSREDIELGTGLTNLDNLLSHLFTEVWSALDNN